MAVPVFLSCSIVQSKIYHLYQKLVQTSDLFMVYKYILLEIQTLGLGSRIGDTCGVNRVDREPNFELSAKVFFYL